MRDGGDIERLGAGFGMARTTSYVRHAEGLEVIAEQAPNLLAALEQAVRDEVPLLIRHGTLYVPVKQPKDGTEFSDGIRAPAAVVLTQFEHRLVWR